MAIKHSFNCGIADNPVDALKVQPGDWNESHDVEDGTITYAKMQNVAADERILGRVSGAGGDVEELTKAHVLTMLGTDALYTPISHNTAPAPHIGHAHRSVADILTIGTSGEEFATPQLAYDYIEGNIDGNQIMRISAGTYSGNLDMGGKNVSGAYDVTIEAATTTTLVSTTLTGMTTGSTSVQPTLTKTGAGWTVDAYKGKWLAISDGVNIDEIRPINSNTSTVLTLVGEFFSSASSSGDSFIIFDNDVDITGDVCLNPSPVTMNFNNINLHTIEAFNNTINFNQSHHHDFREVMCSLSYSKCVLFADTAPWDTTLPLCLEVFNGFVLLDETLVHGQGKATVAIGVFSPSGLTRLFNGTVIEDVFFGAFARDRIELNGGFGNKTDVWLKNNEFGLYAVQGGKIYGTNESSNSGNTTDTFAEAASFSYVGV